jgi:hypothetical protein
MKTLLALVLTLAPTAAFAYPKNYDNYQPGWSASQTCVKKVYREEYVPGTQSRPGYVKTYYDEVKVLCDNAPVSQYYEQRPPATYSPPPVSNRNCVRGSILGGILGGGIAAGISKPDAMPWSIPVGVVTGAIAGCEVQRN